MGVIVSGLFTLVATIGTPFTIPPALLHASRVVAWMALVLACIAWLLVHLQWLQPLRARQKDNPLVVLILVGVIGAALAVGMYLLTAPRQEGGSDRTAKQSPPIYVTRVEVVGPFIAGERFNTRIHIFNKRAGGTVRARGSARFIEVPAQKYEEQRQAIEDEMVWRPVLSSSDLIDVPAPIKLPEGEYSLNLAPMTLQPRNVEAIQNGTAVVYLAGQIDFGDGALDYCYVWRPDGTVKPCLDHNGPAPKRIF